MSKSHFFSSDIYIPGSGSEAELDSTDEGVMYYTPSEDICECISWLFKLWIQRGPTALNIPEIVKMILLSFLKWAKAGRRSISVYLYKLHHNISVFICPLVLCAGLREYSEGNIMFQFMAFYYSTYWSVYPCVYSDSWKKRVLWAEMRFRVTTSKL